MRVAPFPSPEPGGHRVVGMPQKNSLLYLLPLARLIQRPANLLQVQAGLAVLTRRRLHQFCCFFVCLFLHFFLPFLAEVAGQSLRSSNERVLLL